MTRKKAAWQTIALRSTFGVLLLIVTHQSLVPRPASVFMHASDKILHVGAWLIVAIALGLAFPRIKPIWIAFLLLFGYSIGIEVGQIFVPGRSFTMLDMVANGIGCGGGYWLAVARDRLVE